MFTCTSNLYQFYFSVPREISILHAINSRCDYFKYSEVCRKRIGLEVIQVSPLLLATKAIQIIRRRHIVINNATNHIHVASYD